MLHFAARSNQMHSFCTCSIPSTVSTSPVFSAPSASPAGLSVGLGWVEGVGSGVERSRPRKNTNKGANGETAR